jgi:hypothetical protein
MKKILIALLLFSTSATSQETLPKEKKISYRKRMDALAEGQINQLKGGVLLVRLQTKKNSLEALRKHGNYEKANLIEKKQAAYNLSIVKAFRTNFDFCPTYFFFSDYSTNVIDDQIDKVVFLNDSLFADTTIKFNNKAIFTAEFGTIEQDTAKYLSHYSYEPNANMSLKRVSNYYGGSNMGFGALIIKSDKFIQLSNPFPYYVRTFDSLPIEKSAKKVVSLMNIKLSEFYNSKNKVLEK